MEELKELRKKINELEDKINETKFNASLESQKIFIPYHRKRMMQLLTYYDCVERIKKAIKPTECFRYDDEKTGDKWLRVICPKCGNEHNAYVGTTDYHCGECGQLLDMSDWRKYEEK